MLTLSALRQEVTRRLSESSSSPVYYSAADVDKALGEGFQTLSDSTEWYERRAPFKSIARRTYYDLRTITPDMVLTVRAVWNHQTQQWLRPASVRDLDYEVYSQWERNIGGAVRAQSFIVRGLWWLGLWPKNTKDGDLYTLVYRAIPPVLTADGSTLGLPAEFEDAVICYALYDLYAQDRETNKALVHYKEYQEAEVRFKKFILDRGRRDRTIAMRAGI